MFLMPKAFEAINVLFVRGIYYIGDKLLFSNTLRFIRIGRAAMISTN